MPPEDDMGMSDEITEPPMDLSGAPEVPDDMEIGDAQLDEDMYDYGGKKIPPTGQPVDVAANTYQGPEQPQRIAQLGNNPLIAELHNKLVSEYSRYLEEAERENADGVMSPLSDSDKSDFVKDPFAGMEAVDNGIHSPLSTIKRQRVPN